jgi:hypothetical protein
MVVETTAALAVAATILAMAPYTQPSVPGDLAVHAVNTAMKGGTLGRVHQALKGTLT